MRQFRFQGVFFILKPLIYLYCRESVADEDSETLFSKRVQNGIKTRSRQLSEAGHGQSCFRSCCSKRIVARIGWVLFHRHGGFPESALSIRYAMRRLVTKIIPRFQLLWRALYRNWRARLSQMMETTVNLWKSVILLSTVDLTAVVLAAFLLTMVQYHWLTLY